MKNIKNIDVRLLLAVIIICSHTACKKFVETESPATQINGVNVFESEETATAVLTGVYSNMSQGLPFPGIATGTASFSLLCGLSADEYNLYIGADAEKSAFFRNKLIANSVNNFGTGYWKVLYDYIYVVNNAIEGLTAATRLSDVSKKQLIGEAKFIRAFCYFYLVNLYGDAVLVTSTDYAKNKLLARSSKEYIYEQIKKDLLDAEDLISSDYLDGKLQKYASTAERVRPTKWAVKALQARVYLYTSDFVNAEASASILINNIALFDTVSLNSVFLKNSKEAIWQLQPISANQNTSDSRMFIITTGFSFSKPVWLSDTLLKSFEPADFRRLNGNWVNSTVISGNIYYYPYKYKNNTGTVTEYLMVLRLAEQYLIRAEARARQNKLGDAISDLDVIRKRARLPLISNAYPGIGQAALVDKILHERQVELFSEWGHRWLDLKRTNTLDALMTLITPKKANGDPWQAHQKLYPLSFRELQTGINLVQNPGY